MRRPAQILLLLLVGMMCFGGSWRTQHNLGSHIFFRQGKIAAVYGYWLLRDDFPYDVAAGSVNGTAAVPGPGTRAVTDADSKLSITGEKAVFSSNIVANSLLTYSGYARENGRIFICKINVGASTNAFLTLTLHDPIYTDIYMCSFLTGASIYDTDSNMVGTFTLGTDYYVAFVILSTGCRVFIKGGTEYTNWTLLITYASGTEVSLDFDVYFENGAAAAFTASVDMCRVPTALWPPVVGQYSTLNRFIR